MKKNIPIFIRQNSPDGGFLQSEYWRKFQESVGRKTFSLEENDEKGDNLILANMIVHTLPVVGNYFYTPRGPILIQSAKLKAQNHSAKLKSFFTNLFELAKREKIGWVRVEPNSEEELGLIKNGLSNGIEIKKSAVDVQPREILALDIAKSEEELLAEMKQKTRYNIRLAEKKGVKIIESRDKKYIDSFLNLIKITAERDKIAVHPEGYYRKMFEMIPPEILKLYAAEYEGKIIAANLVSFFGETATYMHGASASEYRNVMAPHLLQWRQILDAKTSGCTRYDFGGINTQYRKWEGITRFKIGFAPNIEPIKFPGCWDIVLNSKKYFLYRFLQKIKKIF